MLEKNYDPEEFISYLNSKLNIESDVDRCSFEQLKDVVKEFINEKESNIIENMGSIYVSQSVIGRKF